MNIIETTRLTHRFDKGEMALDQISLQVPQGSIYGFLGPNGAGKTTTLRLILGLLKKQEGDIRLFGEQLSNQRTELLRKTGSLIESPSIYPQLTATENLRVLQLVYGADTKRIGAVLETVGLAQTGKKKAGQFSLGMKQRLSIAMALLHQPQLLILDEPTNGLDPKGIIEVRELLRKLNQEQGITVLVSSHLLAEIEKLVTHIGIINKGHLLFQGRLSELKARQEEGTRILLETDDAEKTAAQLTQMQIPFTREEQGFSLAPVDREQVAALIAALAAAQVKVYQVSLQKSDLESIFIGLTDN